MPSLDQVFDAIVSTAQDNLPGVTGYTEMPEQVNVPAVIIQPTTADFDVAMGRGTDTWPLTLIVLVCRTDDKLAQRKLRPYVDGGGDKSLRKLFFLNKTLGLANTDAHISGMGSFNGQWEVGGYTYAGAALTLVVNVKPE